MQSDFSALRSSVLFLSFDNLYYFYFNNESAVLTVPPARVCDLEEVNWILAYILQYIGLSTFCCLIAALLMEDSVVVVSKKKAIVSGTM